MEQLEVPVERAVPPRRHGDHVAELPVVLGRELDALRMGDPPHDRGGDGATEMAVELRQRDLARERTRHASKDSRGHQRPIGTGPGSQLDMPRRRRARCRPRTSRREIGIGAGRERLAVGAANDDVRRLARGTRDVHGWSAGRAPSGPGASRRGRASRTDACGRQHHAEAGRAWQEHRGDGRCRAAVPRPSVATQASASSSGRLFATWSDSRGRRPSRTARTARSTGRWRPVGPVVTPSPADRPDRETAPDRVGDGDLQPVDLASAKDVEPVPAGRPWLDRRSDGPGRRYSSGPPGDGPPAHRGVDPVELRRAARRCQIRTSSGACPDGTSGRGRRRSGRRAAGGRRNRDRRPAGRRPAARVVDRRRPRRGEARRSPRSARVPHSYGCRGPGRSRSTSAGRPRSSSREAPIDVVERLGRAAATLERWTVTTCARMLQRCRSIRA